MSTLLGSTATSHKEFGLIWNTTMKYGEIDVHHRLHVSSFQYATQSARDSAIQHWFDCFTILCDPLPPYENRRFTKSRPRFVILNSTSIISLRTRCETAGDEWERNIKQAEAMLGEENHTTLRVGCGGPIEWSMNQAPAPN